MKIARLPRVSLARKPSLRRKISIAIVFAVLCLPATFALPVVVNGDFENPRVDPGGGSDPGHDYLTFFPTDHVPGFEWIVLGDSIELVGRYWNGASGAYLDQSLDLNGNHAGGIAQNIFFEPGTYSVNFSLSGNPNVGGVKTLRVSLGTQFEDFTFDSSGHDALNMGWESKSALFSLTTPGTYALSFLSLTVNSNQGQDGSGPALDRVSISQVVPEHLGNMAFAGIAAVVLLTGARRKEVIRHA